MCLLVAPHCQHRACSRWFDHLPPASVSASAWWMISSRYLLSSLHTFQIIVCWPLLPPSHGKSALCIGHWNQLGFNNVAEVPKLDDFGYKLGSRWFDLGRWGYERTSQNCMKLETKRICWVTWWSRPPGWTRFEWCPNQVPGCLSSQHMCCLKNKLHHLVFYLALGTCMELYELMLIIIVITAVILCHNHYHQPSLCTSISIIMIIDQTPLTGRQAGHIVASVQTITSGFLSFITATSLSRVEGWNRIKRHKMLRDKIFYYL